MAEVITTTGPKVSVIMLISNGRTHLLKRAVQSVLNQNYKNVELILQDDCSTDGTFEMAIGFALLNKNVKIFRNKVKSPVGKSRAAAFRSSGGDLICHVDDDDFIYPHAIETMVKVFNECPDIGMAYSDMAFVDDNAVPFSYSASKNPGGPMTDYGWRHLGMYRRAAYNATKGYNEALGHCEDGDLFMQIAEKFPFVRVPHVLYAYQNGGGGSGHLSSKKPPCEECPSRGSCNYIRVWASGLTEPEHIATWQKRIEETHNG